MGNTAFFQTLDFRGKNPGITVGINLGKNAKVSKNTKSSWGTSIQFQNILHQ
jgi:hypothetical protein